MRPAIAGAYINSCEDCDIAWLYKDAKMFGFSKYRDLVGDNNAICPNGIGPVLETDDPDFIARMENCPCRFHFIFFNVFNNQNCLILLLFDLDRYKHYKMARYSSRFFERVGHENTFASKGNHHVFNIVWIMSFGQGSKC